VVLFEADDRLGGHLAIAAAAPNRSGWRSLLDFYAGAVDRAGNVEVRLTTSADPELLEEFDHVVLAIGAEEVLPDAPGIERALSSSRFIAERPGPSTPGNLVIVDDGFGWWPCASAIETGIAAGWPGIIVLTPGTGFGARLPPEGHVQLIARLRGAPLEIRPLSAVELIDPGSVTVRNVVSGRVAELPADLVVVVGERRALAPDRLLPVRPGVYAIGDMIAPRRVQHAIAEGSAVARQLSLRGCTES
jgi:2,4-dienoyl-CoA reductase (NADPH2)